MNGVAKDNSVSIDWIANRVATWAIVATSLFVTVFSCVALLTEVKASYHREEERMNVVMPAVARSVAGQLLVGDDSGLRLLSEELKKQFELADLRIVSHPDACLINRSLIAKVFPYLAVCSVIPLREIRPNVYLLVESGIKNIGWFSGLSTIFWVSVPLILFGIYCTVRIKQELKRSIATPIQELANNPEKWDGGKSFVAREAIQLHQRIKKYIADRDMEREKNEKLKIEASIGEVAAQVAHDIRSPLAALDVIASDLKPLPEEKRVLIRSAISRIRDIANGLVEKQLNVQEQKRAASSSQEITHELLSSLIDVIITEKHMQYRTRIGVQIDAVLTKKSYGLFSAVHTTEFKRVMSNLIDNAVQAIPDTGQVSVELEPSVGEVLIRIVDNGKGIPTEQIPQLMEKGASFSKKQGLGLGLYHAKNCIQRWGGRLSIESVFGRGTIVEIHLPRGPVPKWFVPEIILENGSSVVILDDDPSIHHIWKGRFESAKLRERRIDTIHFSTGQQLRDWVSLHPERRTHSTYLIDYELSDHDKNGLEVIEDLGIQDVSILVTSRFEEESIRKICRELRVKVIPKSLAGFVPIVA